MRAHESKMSIQHSQYMSIKHVESESGTDNQSQCGESPTYHFTPRTKRATGSTPVLSVHRRPIPHKKHGYTDRDCGPCCTSWIRTRRATKSRSNHSPMDSPQRKSNKAKRNTPTFDLRGHQNLCKVL